MSVQTPQATKGPAGYEAFRDEDRGYGWVTFAGVMLLAESARTG